MKILPILVISAVLAGCCTPDQIYVDRIVEVPTIVMQECPPPPKVDPMTTTPLDSLHEGSSNADVARAYVKTVKQCENKLKQYEEALNAMQDESQ